MEEVSLLSYHVAKDQLPGCRISEQDRPGIGPNDIERHMERMADQLVSIGILEHSFADPTRRVQLPFSKEQELISSPT